MMAKPKTKKELTNGKQNLNKEKKYSIANVKKS